MLVNLYSSKTPIAVLSLPVFIGLLTIPVFLVDFQEATYFLTWHQRLTNFVQHEQWINFGLTVGLVSLTAHQINNVFNRHTFFPKATFLPGMIYAICLYGLKMMRFSPDLIAHLFIVLALAQLLKLRRQEPAKTVIFWGSVLTGLAITFSSFSVLLLLLPWLALATFRPFVWREWIMVILGGALPLIYYVTVLYLVKGDLHLAVAQPARPPGLHLDLFQAANYGIFGLVVIASAYKYFVVFRAQVNRFKKQSQVLGYFLLLSTIIWLVGYYVYDSIYMAFTIPLSFFIATPFLHAKRPVITNGVVIIWLIISTANILMVR